MPLPTLLPLPPTRGESISVDRSPWWIGSSSSGSLRLFLPGIAERHASITEREDGYYLSPMSGVSGIEVDGRAISGPTRLDDAAIIVFAPAARFEFVTGEPRNVPAAEAPAPDAPEYEVLGPSGQRRPWWRQRRRARTRRVGFPLWGWAAVVLIVAAVGFGTMVLIRTIRSATDTPSGPPPLTEVEGRIYDSLMVESTRSIERGSTLLDMGLPEEAQRQFAEAIAVLESDPTLSRNEWVRQSINRITQAVIDIYRFKQLNPPSGIRPAAGRLADLSRTLASNLTSDQFQSAVDNVRSAFRATYGDTVVVTGRDHPEHVSLYGPGSAMDIRVRNLTRPQVSFLVTSFGRMGIRVKDFSTDEILQRQIAAARARGWNDRAGTGLHLHIDRFRDRSDRWTVKPGG